MGNHSSNHGGKGKSGRKFNRFIVGL